MGKCLRLLFSLFLLTRFPVLAQQTNPPALRQPHIAYMLNYSSTPVNVPSNMVAFMGTNQVILNWKDNGKNAIEPSNSTTTDISPTVNITTPSCYPSYVN